MADLRLWCNHPIGQLMDYKKTKDYLLERSWMLRKVAQFKNKLRLFRRFKRRFYYPYYSVLRGLLFIAKGCRYETDGCRFIVPRKLISLPMLAQYHSDVYEEHERALVREHVRPDDKVLELGGCIGVVACVTERLLTDKAATHVVVEANPNLIPWLLKNLSRNDAQSIVEFCAIAEGNVIAFNLNDRIDKGSLFEKGSNTVSVPCRTIMDLEQKYGEFNTLVMDIQGAEIEVLKIAGDLLNHYRLLVIEWHEYITGAESIESSKAMLTRYGFTLSKQIGPVEAWERR